MSTLADISPKTPVLVGIGTVLRKEEGLEHALEPSALMAKALRRAAADAGSEELLRQADSIRVPRGFWGYSDPGQLVAKELGAAGVQSTLAEIGILQQTLFTRACEALAAGAEKISLVVGGEARFRALQASKAGKEAPETMQEDAEPSEVLRPREDFGPPLEGERGLVMPVHSYALIENVLRYQQGQSPTAHRDEVAALWAGMSRVAAGNPDAWSREPVTAEQVSDATMLSFPYTKLHTSQWNVDQAAGLILCQAQTARDFGVPEEKWVFPLAAAENNHMVPISQRDALHKCPGARLAATAALEAAELEQAELDFIELYSCFPSALRVQARELGISLDTERPPTVTGGMRFAGGPLNNYVLQATAKMAQCLRAKPGSTGLVSSVSGLLHKQGFGVWASRPPRSAFRAEDLSAATAREMKTCPLRQDAKGEATVAGYTVHFEKGEAKAGIALCDLPDGARAIARSQEKTILERMIKEEFCGQRVQLEAKGIFQMAR